jgi:hypothetical protein
MAIAWVQEFEVQGSDRSTTNYDAVAQRVNAENDPPRGLILHTAGFDEQAGVFRIFDVWESREHRERFHAERLKPILDEVMAGAAGAGPPSREYEYELHDVAPR